MDATMTLTFVWVLWTTLLYDACSAARSGSSTSKTGSAGLGANSGGFVGGPDTSSPSFIIFMTIFGMCVLAVIIFLVIMFCKIRRCYCFKLHILPGSLDKKQIVDSVNDSDHWSTASDPPLKNPPLPPSPIVDPKKKPVIPSILITDNLPKPRAKSPDSSDSLSLPPIYTLPYPVSTGTNAFTPPPEPELSDGYSESVSESTTFDEGVESVLSDHTQSELIDYNFKKEYR